jgi:predicted transcriptional regulator
MVDNSVQIINLASISYLARKEGRHVQIVKREVNVLINFSSGVVDYLKALQVND